MSINTTALFEDFRESVDMDWVERMISGTSESCIEVINAWSNLLSINWESVIENTDVILKYIAWKLLVRPVPNLTAKIYTFFSDYLTVLISTYLMLELCNSYTMTEYELTVIITTLMKNSGDKNNAPSVKMFYQTLVACADQRYVRIKRIRYE